MYINTWEVHAEEEGWKVYKVVQTIEEAIDLINQLRKLGIQCRRAHRVFKTLDIDCYFVWVKPSDKPFKPKQRMPNMNNKKNMKCLHCKHWQRQGYELEAVCELTGEVMKHYNMRTKCFECKEEFL